MSVCPSLVAPPQARIIDPNTLETISTYDLPNAPEPARTRQEYQNFTGGGYFFLDDKDRIWVADEDRPHLRHRPGRRRQHADARARLRPHRGPRPGTERISSALPDFNGRIWFVSKANGKVGTLDPDDGRSSR